MPGADGLEAFSELLFSGRDAVGEVPPERWARELFYHPSHGEHGKAYTYAAGCLGAIDRFDPAFFGMSAREAAHVDPQQRLLLELVHEAMEDAGIPAGRLAGCSLGVYVGGSSWDYSTISAGDLASTDAYSMQGVALSSMANRISYQFDLRGPSLTVDTACSSSLVALHLACEALRRGEIPAALVGGVNLLLAPHPFVGFARAAMLSRRGRCQPFAAGADGYVRAEGGGAVLLKPLAAALADQDTIRGVILATGVNSDGHSNGFLVPSAQAQERLVRQVHASAGIAADDVCYFEAHGTGTPVGDPLEASAIGRSVGQNRRAPLPIGSVKGNVGHLEAASGMAGLMKLLAALARREIPASLHCPIPNPGIPFGQLNIEVATASRPMQAGSAGFVVAINSFGFGGTNAHAVLAAAPERRWHAAARRQDEVLPPLLLSARAPEALTELAQAWLERLGSAPAGVLAPMLRGAARLRDHYPHRLAVPGAPAAAMATALASWLDRGSGAAADSGQAVAGEVAFVFSGNGSQWPGMAADALAHCPAFRDMVETVDAILTPLLGWSVTERLLQPASAEALRNTAIAQPLLFAVQVASVAALRAHGVQAAAYVGHSVGEVAAAWAAGALDLEQAAQVIVARSSAQQTLHGVGGMAVLGLGAEAAEAALARVAPGLAIAAVNAANSVTVAGPDIALAKLRSHALAMGWSCIAMDLDYAFHCALMDPLEDMIVAGLSGLRPAVPASLLISTVTGQRMDEPAMGGSYWWRNVREPVRFADAVAALLATGVRVLLEVGPQPVLQSYMRDALKRSAVPGRVLATLSRSQVGSDPFAAAAARLYVAGADLRDAPALRGEATASGLPLYPWQRDRFWHERSTEAQEIIAPPRDHPLLGYREGFAAPAWFSHPSTAVERWLGDHVVDGAVVMPAAGMIEMALAAGRALFPDAASLELQDLQIVRALQLAAGADRAVTLRVGADGHGFAISSRQRMTGDAPSPHASGRVLPGSGAPAAFSMPVTAPATHEIGAAALYQSAAALKLTYGPAFRTVRRVTACGAGQARVELDDRGADRVAQGYLVDPALLDGALQGLIGLAAASAFGPMRGAVLPWWFGRVRLLRLDASRPVQALLHLRRQGERSLLADVALLDASGAVVMELLDCWFAAVHLGTAADPAEQMVWTALVASASQPAWQTPDLLDGALGAVATAAAVPESVRLTDAMLALAARDSAEAMLADSGAPSAARVSRPLARMLAWLEQDGMATADGAGWRIAAADSLPSWQAVWRDLLFAVPAAAAELALAGTVARGLGAATADPIASPLLEQMLFASPTGAGALEALLAAAAAFVERWPAGRPLRAAVAGMACPGFIRRLLELLAPRANALRCVAFVPDEAALAATTEVLAGRPGAIGRIWRPAGEAETFDLVLGLYPASATPAEMAALLAPGGHLLTIQAAPSRLWELLHAQAAHALPGLVPWQAALEAGGCARTRSLVLAGGEVWQAALIGAWRATAPVLAEAPARPDWAVMAAGDQPVARRLALMTQTGRLETPGAPAPGCTAVVVFPEEGAAALAELAASLPAFGATPVWLVTRDAGVAAPAGGALLGLLRTLANEVPELDCRLLRLDPALSDDAAVDCIAAELRAPDAEREVVWTPAGRFVRRLRRGAPRGNAAGPGAARLTVAQPGLLGSLRWEIFDPPPPAPGEVAIAVQAIGLNFRDLMWAQGLLPEEALMHGFSGATLGLECAGVVTAVGAGVEDLAPGARVIAVAPAAMASAVVTLRRAVIPMPEAMTMAEAATIPVAFLTAVYALGRLADLRPGERVLIHGGLGSLGLAAIQYALHRGAVVYATAGSLMRRDLLDLLGLAGVFDSRSTRFADDLLAATGGEGVDVVLNSLSGALMECGLRVLRPFGRFIEVGKRDLYANSSLGLRPLRHNIAYFAVDADALAAQRPELTGAILAEITELLAAGRLRPLPHRCYDSAAVIDAFRQLQASGHIGKIVVTPPPVTAAAAPARPAFVVHPDRTYVLTGAVGGFGLEAAAFLGRHGARHVALLSRRGADTHGAAAAVARLRALGMTPRLFACDVADAAALAATLAAIRAGMPPIAGVLHAAMVLDDAWAKDLDAARFAAVLAPKLGGAHALDRLTRADAIDLFVLFSSVTTLLGNPGQANYVAANLAMEAVAERRHAAGLPALAVTWGPIGDAGYLARAERVSAALERLLGAAHAAAAAALEVLPALLASGLPVCGLSDLQWSAVATQLPGLRGPLLEEMPADGRVAISGGSMRRLLAGLPADEAAAAVLGVLAEEIAAILRIDPARVDADRMLTDLGMDSLTAVELRTALQARLDLEIPISSVSGGGTLRAVATRIARLAAAPAPLDDITGRIAQFEATEDEAWTQAAQ